VLLNVSDPVPDVVEGLLIGDIVHEQDSHGTSVVGSSNGSEALLSSSIPNLQFYALALQVNGSDLEVNANGCDEAGRERVIRETQEQAAFANTTVSNEKKLDKIVISGAFARGSRCTSGSCHSII